MLGAACGSFRHHSTTRLTQGLFHRYSRDVRVQTAATLVSVSQSLLSSGKWKSLERLALKENCFTTFPQITSLRLQYQCD